MRPVYLLDTNIICEFAKPAPDEKVWAVFTARKNLCAIAAVTWQEIQYGLARMAAGRKRDYLEQYFSAVQNEFEIIDYDCFAAKICGETMAKCERAGNPIPYCDSQIAATAIARNMILVTRNVGDFAAICGNSSLSVENWFA